MRPSVGSNAPAARPELSRLCLLYALLTAAMLLSTAPAVAQQVPEERTSLIKLGSRVFDLGADVRYMRRYENFIPITRVRWIKVLVDGDPYLRFTVIHIKSFADSLGTPIWRPDEDRQDFALAKDLAEAWALEGYDVRWMRKVAPSNRGNIVLFPKAADAQHYVLCGYDRAEAVPSGCTVDALYPPDSDLRVRVRIYNTTDPLNDFETIVEKALNLVYCLDVTREIDTDAWRPREIDKPQGLAEFVMSCKST